jgi:hypothetical protein
MSINSTKEEPRHSLSVGLCTITINFVLSIIILAYIGTYQNSILGEPTTTPLPKLTYSSDTFGVSIDYPAGEWDRTNENDGAVGENITIVKFSLCQDKRVNVALTIDNFSENSTLEQYTKNKINSVSSLPSSILSTKEIIEHNDTRINTYPGYEMTLKSNIPFFWNAFSTISTDYWTVKNNTAYGIVYSAPEDQHAAYLSVVKEMVDSFQIVKGTGENSTGVIDMVPINTSYNNASVIPLPILC